MAGAADTETRHLRLIEGGNGSDDSSMADLGHADRRFAWFDKVRNQLEGLNKLRRNWDGYGAPPIPFDTVLFAFQLLNEIHRPGLGAPDISPMSDEGIMIEWLVGEVEFTLEVHGPYEVIYTFEKDGVGKSESGFVAQEFRLLDRFVCAVIEASREIGVAA